MSEKTTAKKTTAKKTTAKKTTAKKTTAKKTTAKKTTAKKTTTKKVEPTKEMTVEGLDIKDIENAKTKEEVEDFKVTGKTESKVVNTEKGGVELKEGDVVSELDDSGNLIENFVKVKDEDYIEYEDLRVYIETAVTNQAKRMVAEGNMNMNIDGLKQFVNETCGQCQYADSEKAFRFAKKCVGKVSTALLM